MGHLSRALHSLVPLPLLGAQGGWGGYRTQLQQVIFPEKGHDQAELAASVGVAGGGKAEAAVQEKKNKQREGMGTDDRGRSSRPNWVRELADPMPLTQPETGLARQGVRQEALLRGVCIPQAQLGAEAAGVGEGPCRKLDAQVVRVGCREEHGRDRRAEALGGGPSGLQLHAHALRSLKLYNSGRGRRKEEEDRVGQREDGEEKEEGRAAGGREEAMEGKAGPTGRLEGQHDGSPIPPQGTGDQDSSARRSLAPGGESCSARRKKQWPCRRRGCWCWCWCRCWRGCPGMRPPPQPTDEIPPGAEGGTLCSLACPLGWPLRAFCFRFLPQEKEKERKRKRERDQERDTKRPRGKEARGEKGKLQARERKGGGGGGL